MITLSKVQIHATVCAFAAILGDGSVVSRGDAACGGDSNEVHDQLKKSLSYGFCCHSWRRICRDLGSC